MRRLTAFPCAGETLVATLDPAPGRTGLLIVSGGNEPRIGAHRGMAMLAARIAAAGHPVFRYDRRGIGDSTGDNRGFLGARADLIAAAAAFRAEAPQLDTLLGFGNCDAASTLALFGRDAGIDRLLLANPWVIDQPDDLPPAAAIRARYRERLRDPATWRRLISGGIDLARLVKGLKKLATTSSQPDGLGRRVAEAIATWGESAHILLAAGDATAIAYQAAATGAPTRTTIIDTDSHSFAREADQHQLHGAITAALAATA
ncbi:MULTISPECIES: hydrolase 1, exosortase A system-associated [unclassified Sphingomonas]|uniref:hydrolase 1, exosortase A system-associated n=1 Tax=unclassified Sphingomonas TaxID=196159 RepID=UPI00226997A2|nr:MULTISPECIES: hydrolase 1, exosortase A system-associated [unclassified Sphingomonas]